LGRPVAAELAGRTWAEKAGSFTNFEGVVAAFGPALKGPAAARSDLEWIADLADGFNLDLPRDAAAAWAAFAAESPGLSAVDCRARADRTAVATGSLGEVRCAWTPSSWRPTWPRLRSSTSSGSMRAGC